MLGCQRTSGRLADTVRSTALQLSHVTDCSLPWPPTSFARRAINSFNIAIAFANLSDARPRSTAILAGAGRSAVPTSQILTNAAATNHVVALCATFILRGDGDNLHLRICLIVTCGFMSAQQFAAGKMSSQNLTPSWQSQRGRTAGTIRIYSPAKQSPIDVKEIDLYSTNIEQPCDNMVSDESPSARSASQMSQSPVQVEQHVHAVSTDVVIPTPPTSQSNNALSRAMQLAERARQLTVQVELEQKYRREVDHHLQHISALRRQVESASDRANSLEALASGLRHDLAVAQADGRVKDEALASAKHELSALRGDVIQLLDEVQRIREENGVLDGRIADLNVERERLIEQVNGLEIAIQGASQQIQDATLLMHEAEQRAATTEAELRLQLQLDGSKRLEQLSMLEADFKQQMQQLIVRHDGEQQGREASHRQQLETQKAEHERQMQEQQQQYEEKLQEQDAHLERQLRSAVDTAASELRQAQADAVADLALCRTDAAAEVAQARADAAAQLSQAQADAAAQLAQAQSDAAAALAQALAQAQGDASAELARVQDEAAVRLARTEAEHLTALAAMQSKHDADIADQASAHAVALSLRDQQIEQLKTEIQALHAEKDEIAKSHAAEIQSMKDVLVTTVQQAQLTQVAQVEQLAAAAKQMKSELAAAEYVRKMDVEAAHVIITDLKEQLAESQTALEVAREQLAGAEAEGISIQQESERIRVEFERIPALLDAQRTAHAAQIAALEERIKSMKAVLMDAKNLISHPERIAAVAKMLAEHDKSMKDMHHKYQAELALALHALRDMKTALKGMKKEFVGQVKDMHKYSGGVVKDCLKVTVQAIQHVSRPWRLQASTLIAACDASCVRAVASTGHLVSHACRSR